jgi:hypothetical protein
MGKSHRQKLQEAKAARKHGRSQRGRQPQDPLPIEYAPLAEVPKEKRDTEQQAKTEPQADQQKSPKARIGGPHMNFLFAFGYQFFTIFLFAISLTFFGIFFANKNWRGVLWSSIAMACIFLIAFGLFAQQNWHVFQVEAQPAPSPTPPQLEQPRFREQVSEVMVTLGKGISFEVSTRYLEKDRWPIEMTDESTIGYIYMENGNFYFDADLFYSPQSPPIKIRHNEISGRPPEWDINSDAGAFEIVNQNQQPVLQYAYMTPSHIVIKGIFISGPYVYYVSDSMFGSAPAESAQNVPKNFFIKPIFKYPSWKYPGQRAD